VIVDGAAVRETDRKVYVAARPAGGRALSPTLPGCATGPTNVVNRRWNQGATA